MVLDVGKLCVTGSESPKLPLQENILMKTELKAKFLQHLLKKREGDQGFTLIELLVVIIIIGILSAIALPSFLNQAAKARGAEAKSNVGAMNRAQQAYFLEQQAFTSDVPALGLSMKGSTENFDYSAAANNNLAPTSSVATAGVTNFGTSRKADIKSYAGGTFYATGSTTTILCEANNASAAAAAVPTNSTTCGTNTTQVK
jgi:prepilin-type N-terminal cleavage/methylation domain-containing protein